MLFAAIIRWSRAQLWPVHISLPRVPPGTLEACDAIRRFDHVLGHRLHHDPVDVRDLVVAGVDGVDWANPGGNVAVDMQTQFFASAIAAGNHFGSNVP